MNKRRIMFAKALLVLCCAAVGVGVGWPETAQSRPVDDAVQTVWLQHTSMPAGLQPAETSVSERTDSALAFCDNVTQIPRQECEALVALYLETQGADWVQNTGWLDTTTPCSWFGMGCSQGHILAINLDSNRLRGPIPAQLGTLSQLAYLFLSNNQLTGSIPPELGNLTSLEKLNLGGNQLTGSIPMQIGNLSALQELWLNNNLLSGGILSSLGNLTRLRVLALFDNALNGSIPSSLGNLTALESLMLQWNQLTGSIPHQIGNLAHLVTLILERNTLSGEIPAELGQLTSLELMSLRVNDLSGPIPPELGDLAALQKLDLAYNDLTGSIPSELDNLAALRTLGLSHNHLSGPLPQSLGNLANLQTLDLGSNALEGDIPTEITHLTNLITTPSNPTSLAYNRLTASDSSVLAFLAVKDPDWVLTQTIPPSGVSVTPQGTSSYQLTWTPIQYQADGGYYEISYATKRSGPYQVHGYTSDKSNAGYLVSNLPASDAYFFRLRTYTPVHAQQTNELWSAYSNLVRNGLFKVMLPLQIKQEAPVCFTGPWETEPNNNFAQATGPLCFNRDYYGYPNDAHDVFNFLTVSEGRMIIDLTEHTGQGAQLQLFYQTANNRVSFDFTPPYHIEYTGPPGLYYIFIYTAAGFNTSQRYTLRVQF